MTEGGPVFLYVGSWPEKGGDRGLWLHEFDTATGTLTPRHRISDEIECGFIEIDGERDLLYCTDESDQPAGRMPSGAGGRIFTYQADPRSGALHEIGRVPSFGSNPAMVTLDPSRRYLTCAIHTSPGAFCTTVRAADGRYAITPSSASANVVLFPLDEDGRPLEPCDIVTVPYGDAPSYLHTSTWAPGGGFFVVADKGKSALYSFAIDGAARTLVQTAAPYVLAPDAAPRYVRFHPRRSWLFVNHEAANRLTAFAHDDRGVLHHIADAPAVPEEWLDLVPADGKFEQQDLRIDADGRFLYSVFRGSKAGVDTDGVRRYESGIEGVAVWEIDAQTGAPTLVQSLRIDCAWPRGCAISPDGRWLIVSCLYSDELITLSIGEDGRLTETGIRTPQTTAANVTFFAPTRAAASR